MASLLLIILLVHLEYTISSRVKNNLKDKYSHDLGNVLQAIRTNCELARLRKMLSEKELGELDNLLEESNKEAARLINEIRNI
jgi:signal transduction histidine kinase